MDQHKMILWFFEWILLQKIFLPPVGLISTLIPEINKYKNLNEKQQNQTRAFWVVLPFYLKQIFFLSLLLSDNYHEKLIIDNFAKKNICVLSLCGICHKLCIQFLCNYTEIMHAIWIHESFHNFVFFFISFHRLILQLLCYMKNICRSKTMSHASFIH